MHQDTSFVTFIEVTITPKELNSNLYRFEVRNLGAGAVADLELQTWSLMGLGEFGLDDTHATESHPSICIQHLSAGEVHVITQSRQGPLSDYEGKIETQAPVRFRWAHGENEEQVVGMAKVRIVGPASTPRILATSVPWRQIWRNMLPVISLGLLALLVLIFGATRRAI